MRLVIPRAPFATPKEIANASVQTTTTDGVLRNVDIAEQVANEIIGRPPSFLSRLGISTPFDRARTNAEVRLAETEWRAIEKTVFLVRAASTQALEESLNSVLLKGQASVRRETLTFMTGEMNELIGDINSMSVTVAHRIAEHAATAESLTFEPSRQMLLIQAEEQIILFKTWADEVLGKFRTLVNEQLTFAPHEDVGNE